ncbi:MAG: tail fiber domain-containing protein, partial [Flavitalea sp.]
MKKYLNALSCAILFVFLFSYLQVSAQNTSPYWSLAGNSNATATSKLGTTNAINLQVFTNNVERMRILSTNGYVGIGTNAPAARLHVFSTDKQTARFNSNNSTMFLGLYKGNVQRGYIGSTVGFGNDVDFGSSANNITGKVHMTIKTEPKLTIDTRGYVGINTQSPENMLHVKQNIINRAIQIQHETATDYWTTGIGTNTRNYRFEFNGFLRGQIESATGTFTQGSDRQLKTEIKPIGKSLDKLVKLIPSSYYYKDSRSWAKNRSVGFIAQELQEQFPELV